MSLQWDRKCRLTIQTDVGGAEALDLSKFRIIFNVGQPDVSKPKFAEIYIYNVSMATMNLLSGVDSQKLKTKVIFEVGYADGGLEKLFEGTVFQYRRGRDNPTDTWLCVLAQSSDEVINYQTVSESVPAGTSIDGAKKRLLEEYEKVGLQLGESPTLPDQQLIRGRVFFGSLHENMLQLCKENECVIAVADNEINMIPSDKYSIEPLQILTAKTGMIGMPQLTAEGLKVSCLLNPKMKFMARIQVDLTNMQTEAYDIEYGSQGVDQLNSYNLFSWCTLKY